MKRSAFTLIELLVVVAIIVALLAILLPSMNRALEISNRAVCGSNNRQIGAGMLAYASNEVGRVPLGYVDGNMGSHYHMIWAWTTPHRFLMMGTLYGSGIIEDGKVFYCPSQTADHFAYDTPVNRWDEPYVDGSNKQTRSGYSVRPLYKGQAWSWGGLSNPSPPSNMASIQTLGNAVIAADQLALDWAVDGSHSEGANTLRIDGSVNWVQRDVFDAYLTPNLQSTYQDQLWTALDGG